MSKILFFVAFLILLNTPLVSFSVEEEADGAERPPSPASIIPSPTNGSEESQPQVWETQAGYSVGTFPEGKGYIGF